MNDRIPMKRRKKAQAELKPGVEAAVMGCVGSYWERMCQYYVKNLFLGACTYRNSCIEGRCEDCGV